MVVNDIEKGGAYGGASQTGKRGAKVQTTSPVMVSPRLTALPSLLSQQHVAGLRHCEFPNEREEAALAMGVEHGPI